MEKEAKETESKLGDLIDKLAIDMVKNCKNEDVEVQAKIVNEAGRWFAIRYRTGAIVSEEGRDLDVIRRDAFDASRGAGGPAASGADVRSAADDSEEGAEAAA